MCTHNVQYSLAFCHCVTGHSYSYRYVSQVAVLAEVVTMDPFRGTCARRFSTNRSLLV